MSSFKYLSLFLFLVCPQILFAAGQDQHRYTQKEQIEFTETTRTAFDHSGKPQTHASFAGGSAAVENHGSAGNVTVARRGPDGNIETFCTTDITTAQSWMAGEIATRTTVSINTPVVEE